MEDLLWELVERGRRLGASHVEARWHRILSIRIRAENGNLLPPDSESLTGVAVRVLVGPCWGLAYTSGTRRSELLALPGLAVRSAKAMGVQRGVSQLGEARPVRERVAIGEAFNPGELDLVKLNEVVVKTSRESLKVPQIKNATSNLALYRDERLLVTSEGVDVGVSVTMLGVGHTATAALNGSFERVYEQKSFIGSPQDLVSTDWSGFTDSVAELASRAVQAPHPQPGRHRAIIDQRLIGVFLHEAIGHPTEGDIVVEGGSLLQGRLGQEVASPLVTIYDEGMVDGGYPVPYDDEGVPKGRTGLVVEGVLRGYLTSRETAARLGLPPTGNGRAQNHEHPPIVRQTNIYMAPGDLSDEELLRELGEGYYFLGRGAGGGQVDPGAGSFTLNTGPSYRVVGGEARELVRGTTISGDILRTLKGVLGVGRSFRVETSVFGGCGKAGQLAKVGDGGPPVLVGEVVVAGA